MGCWEGNRRQSKEEGNLKEVEKQRSRGKQQCVSGECGCQGGEHKVWGFERRGEAGEWGRGVRLGSGEEG